ncbi:MAG: DNA-processing protein DprA [Bacteroidales bacterium]|nr:DNA-processing protein DprA [Bacteroidales bacterium]
MLIHEIAITLVPLVGDTNGKKLIAYCGDVEEVFRESKKNLLKIPGISIKTVESIINNKEIFNKAEQEISFIENNLIEPIFYLGSRYPKRLKQCIDSPMMIYYKGNGDLNPARAISIVGTRTPTNQGRLICEKFIEVMANYNVQIISGLAYGIDICAHRNSLKNQISTVGVLGSGLDKIYPAIHKSTATEMMEQNGGILTEFMSGTAPDKQNFPKRNRIVAGMSDVVIIVESGTKGGSLITAQLGFGYNRDVAAFPGRPDDAMSKGCNMLIKSNMATLIESAEDLVKLMNWETQNKKAQQIQKSIFVELNETEKLLFDLLSEGQPINIDILSLRTGLPMSKTSAALLNMEFKGLVKALPGKTYQVLA